MVGDMKRKRVMAGWVRDGYCVVFWLLYKVCSNKYSVLWLQWTSAEY